MTLPLSSCTRIMNTGNMPSLSKFSLEIVHGQHAVHALAISRLIAMTAHVPGEDANLVEVEGQSVFGFGEDRQILRNFLVPILNLVRARKRRRFVGPRRIAQCRAGGRDRSSARAPIRRDYASRAPATNLRSPARASYLPCPRQRGGPEAPQPRAFRRCRASEAIISRQQKSGRVFGIASWLNVEICVVSVVPSLARDRSGCRRSASGSDRRLLTGEVTLLHPSCDPLARAL